MIVLDGRAVYQIYKVLHRRWASIAKGHREDGLDRAVPILSGAGDSGSGVQWSKMGEGWCKVT